MAEHGFQAGAVADQYRRHGRVQAHGQGEALLPGRLGDAPGRPLQGLGQRKRRDGKIGLAFLQTRKIGDVVHHLQKPPGGLGDLHQIIGQFGVGGQGLGQIGQADDGRQGRAHLMGHAGHEIGLGLVAGLGLGPQALNDAPGFGQGQAQAVPFGDDICHGSPGGLCARLFHACSGDGNGLPEQAGSFLYIRCFSLVCAYPSRPAAGVGHRAGLPLHPEKSEAS